MGNTKRMLNLGCGTDIKPKSNGWINLDLYKNKGVDVVFDLDSNKKLPFKDSSFDYIYADNVLEHLHNYVSVIRETYRILKPGGIIKIIVPHFSGCGAFGEFHVRFFRWRSFRIGKDKYYNENPEMWNVYRGFHCLNKRIVFNRFMPFKNILSWFATQFPNLYDYSFLCRLFPAQHLIVTLRRQA